MADRRGEERPDPADGVALTTFNKRNDLRIAVMCLPL